MRRFVIVQEHLDQAKADAAAAVGGGLFVTPTPTALQEKLKKVQEENQRLQNKVLRLDQEPARDQDLEERYNKLLEVRIALFSGTLEVQCGILL